ncbi:hypothetical protein BH23ACT9_BH23ACT9_23430 [soil metagenome]
MTTQEQWIRSFVALYLEVEAGLRPARHIRPLLAPQLQPVVGNCGRQGRTPDVLTVRIQSRHDVCEAVVLLRERGRVGALALSITRQEQGWRIADVRRPESPPPEPPTQTVELSLVQTAWCTTTPTDDAPAWSMPAGWAKQPSRAA